MAPKKKQQQTMSLGDFLTDSGYGGGSWADEVEETSVLGTQPLPSSDRPRAFGGGSSSWADRGFSTRESVPATLPDKPPFTAHLGNLSYDATNETVTEFFEGCDVASVRIIEDREMQRPKGFGYVEFGNVEGLKKALLLDGESFQGRMIKIKIADPPRGGDSGRGDFIRDMGDWTRKGPLEPAPSRGPPRGGPDFGERRAPRDPALAPEPGRPARDLNWGERRGPLAPLPQEEGGAEARGPRPAPEGMGERGDSYRGERRNAPAWGEGRPAGEGSRPPRKEFTERPEKPERAPTAAEKDTQWRDRMRPDAAQGQSPSQDGSAPNSPAPAAAAPAARPRLNLQKRTVSEAPDAASPTGGDSKASPFGAARPIDTATREKEIEDKRQQAIEEKRVADEKAKEERRLAKEAAAKAEADNKEKEGEATAETEGEAKPADAEAENAESKENGATEQKIPVRSREPRESKEGAPKPRGFDAGNWRSSGDGQRGGRGGRGGGRGGAPRGPRQDRDVRQPRANGPASQQQAAPAGSEPETPTQDEDGWTTVPKKGRQGRPLAS